MKQYQLEIFDFKKHSSKINLKIKDKAKLEYVFIFPVKSKCPKTLDFNIAIGNNCEINFFFLHLTKDDCKINIKTTVGKNSLFTKKVIVLGRNKQVIDIADDIFFTKSGSIGKIDINTLADNKSSIEYTSDINVLAKSQDTDTSIKMNLNLLSKEAYGILLPALKVSANKVKVSHAATVSSLGNDDKFYLATRGIDESKIKQLLIDSSFNIFISEIKNKQAQKYILKQYFSL